jgi:hypothetical protein
MIRLFYSTLDDLPSQMHGVLSSRTARPWLAAACERAIK